MSKIYHIPLTTFIEFGVHRSPCSSSRLACRSWWAWPAKYRSGMPAFHYEALLEVAISGRPSGPTSVPITIGKIGNNGIGARLSLGLRTQKNKTLALTVHAVRADVDDVALVQARRRALSFDGTVEAAQSSSGLGAEFVADFCKNFFNRLAVT